MVLGDAVQAKPVPKEPAQINNVAIEVPKKLEQSELPQKQEKSQVLASTVTSTGRVFCGSPGQRTWKNINIANADIGQRLASAKGWTGDQWEALKELWACESAWNHMSVNTLGSGAYGIPQALPASKMSTSGGDYLTNPETQIRWGLDYIANRYKTPRAALNFHYANNWY